MQKLITRYLATPTLSNAQKIRAYERAHPFCRCLLEKSELDTIADAIRHANSGVRP